MRSTLALAVAALFCVPTLSAQNGGSVTRLQTIEQRMLQLVNQARAAEGLPPLKANAKLGESAAGHLGWMIAKRSLAHRFPGEGDLTSRVAATGLRFNASAENVAFATDWEDLHPGLMKSPGHRANILSPKYDEVGIAIGRGIDGYYAVQNFAHTTTESGAGEAEARLTRALRSRLRGDTVIAPSVQIREAVCAMAERDHLEASRVPAELNLRRVFAYTAAEPEELPEALVTAAGFPGTRRILIGACYKATEKYPGGTYWIGINY